MILTMMETYINTTPRGASMMTQEKRLPKRKSPRNRKEMDL